MELSIRLMALALLMCAPGALFARTWTNDEGRRLEAELARVRGTTAYLRTEDGLVQAPIDRLSEEDQAWIERHQAMHASRDWGPAEGERVTGEYLSLRDGGVRLKSGREYVRLPFDKLSRADWDHLMAIHELMEQDAPDELLAAKPAPPPKEPDGPERPWTDTKGREIVAKYGGSRGGQALLWRRGREFAFPVEKLSEQDKQWIAERELQRLGERADAAKLFAQGFFAAAAKSAMSQGRPPAAVIPQPRFSPRRSTQGPAPPSRPPPPRRPSPSQGRAADASPTEAPEELRPAPQETAPSEETTLQELMMPTEPVENIKDLPPSVAAMVLENEFGKADQMELQGIAECPCCEAYFNYPSSFQHGDACPFCTEPVVNLTTYDGYVAGSSSEGSSRPWYLRKSFRRLLIFLVITGAGVAVKVLSKSEPTEET